MSATPLSAVWHKENNDNHALSIRSHYLFSWIIKQIIKWNITWLQIPTGRRRTSRLFHKRSQGFRPPRANLGSGQVSALTARPRCLRK